MEKRSGILCFDPVAGPCSRALILGSYPSPKSFALGFYYGHPQNRFWPLLATLAGCPTPHSIPEKKAFLLDHHLALWDSLESCTILGAQDTSITDPVPNDIPALVARTRIEAVFCNGAAAYKYYRKFCQPGTGLPAVQLPSTSPANAAFTMARLLHAWAPLRNYLNREA